MNATSIALFRMRSRPNVNVSVISTGAVTHAVDDAGLQRIAERVEHATRNDDRYERMNAEMNVGEVRNIGAQHDERAVQDV